MRYICGRGYNSAYIYDVHGGVRMCAWLNQYGTLGNILEDDFSDIMTGKKAEALFGKMADGKYEECGCCDGMCMYMMNDEMKDNLVEYTGLRPYPSELNLAFEHICNYRCSFCAASKMIDDFKDHNYEKNLDLIEVRLTDVLPHIKTISANGNGELFCSPRTLRLLANWNPIAPKEEISVELESNGSLFNEKNWEKISNLGQYNLGVTITVTSFEEAVYQYLSGTNLPISNMEHNLEFLAKLRKEGVINHLTITNIVQEINFREMPSFAKKCIEHYNVDVVNFRPIFIRGNAGGADENIKWFFDVRNPWHPYYKIYKKILEDPIFDNPKVYMFAGDYDSDTGNHPGIKQRDILKMVSMINNDSSQIIDWLVEKIENQTVIIYGAGIVGRCIFDNVKDKHGINIKGFIDLYSNRDVYKNMPIYHSISAERVCDVVVLSVYDSGSQLEKQLYGVGFRKVINVFDLCRDA